MDPQFIEAALRLMRGELVAIDRLRGEWFATAAKRRPPGSRLSEEELVEQLSTWASEAAIQAMHEFPVLAQAAAARLAKEHVTAELDRTRQVLEEGIAGLRRELVEEIAAKASPADAELPLELTRVAPTPRNELSYRARAVPMIGRNEQLGRLRGFLSAPEPLLWWLVVGAAGCGKSRLAFEICLEVAGEWLAGFLRSDRDADAWASWEPGGPTLIVADHARSRGEDLRRLISDLYERTAALEHPVRLLLLERTGGDWLLPPHADELRRLAMSSTWFGDELRLGPLEPGEQWELVTAVLAERGDAAPADREGTLAGLQRADPAGRPLFITLATHGLASGVGLRHQRELVPDLFEREQQLYWAPAGVTEEDKNLVALFTMTGAAGRDLIDIALESHVPKLLPAFAPGAATRDFARHQAIVGADAPGVLEPLKPDVLGEYFVLEHLQPAVDPRGDRAAALAGEAYRVNPLGLLSFIHSAYEDFPDHPGLEVLDRPWGDGPDDRYMWASNLFFRMDSLAAQGQFDRLLRYFRRNLEWARETTDSAPDGWLAPLALEVVDLVKTLGDAGRLLDAQAAYDDYVRYLSDVSLEHHDHAQTSLATVEHDLIVLGCLKRDPKPFKRLWKRLAARALVSPITEVVADAAWAGHDVVVSFAKSDRTRAPAVFGDMIAVLDAQRERGAAPGSVADRSSGFGEAPVRCVRSLIAAAWQHDDFDECVEAFVAATSYLQRGIVSGERRQGGLLPAFEDVLASLAEQGQVLMRTLVEKQRFDLAGAVVAGTGVLADWFPSDHDVTHRFAVDAYQLLESSLDAGEMDAASAVYECMAARARRRTHDALLREGTEAGGALYSVRCAEFDMVERSEELLEELRALVADAVAKGDPADRTKLVRASFCVSAAQLRHGRGDTARGTLERLFDAVPRGEALDETRRTFGDDVVDGVLRALPAPDRKI